MEIEAAVYLLVNLLFKVWLWSLIIASPIIALILLMYGYDRYKRWKHSEEKEYEEIIVAKANNIMKQDEELERQSKDKDLLLLDIKLLKRQKRALENELNVDEVLDEVIDEPEYKNMTVKELLEIAKEKGHKGVSRLSKKELVKLLNKEAATTLQ